MLISAFQIVGIRKDHEVKFLLVKRIWIRIDRWQSSFNSEANLFLINFVYQHNLTTNSGSDSSIWIMSVKYWKKNAIEPEIELCGTLQIKLIKISLSIRAYVLIIQTTNFIFVLLQKFKTKLIRSIIAREAHYQKYRKNVFLYLDSKCGAT